MDKNIFLCQNSASHNSVSFQGIPSSDRQGMYSLFPVYDDLSCSGSNRSRQKPVIHLGHCIRCGLCVEICPELVLDSGRVHTKNAQDGTYMQFQFHITVNPVTCMGCGICSVACPVNKEIDPQLAAKGTSTSDEVIMRVYKGINTVFHEEKCTGCKTCEEQCPNRSVMVARVLEPLQITEEP